MPSAARSSTAREQAHVLGRTVAGAMVLVRGEPATVQATGVVARDGLALAMGLNSIAIVRQGDDNPSLAERTRRQHLLPPCSCARSGRVDSASAIGPYRAG